MTPTDKPAKRQRIEVIKTLAEANNANTTGEVPVVDKRRARKIPADLNMTQEAKPESNESAKAVAADIERDNTPRAKASDGRLSIADVAKALGVDPKLARAKLRRLSAKGELPPGMECVDGRWARVVQGDALHTFLVACFMPMTGDATTEPTSPDGDLH